MEPQGIVMTLQGVLDMVEDGEDHDHHERQRTAVYRGLDGKLYALGMYDECQLWQECKWQYMGPVSLVREQVAVSRKTGVREKSLVWYLLTDVERENLIQNPAS